MRSPLHKSMEFQAAVDSVGLDGLGIVYKGPPSYASSTSPKVTGQPRWRDTSKRTHYPHHRRTSTAAIIALAQKQSLTPQKVIALFSIVASATYLARALPPLWPNEPASVYNPRVVYHPAEIYEAMRPVDPKHRSKKARKSPLKAPRRPQIIVNSETAQSVEQAKAKANQDSFTNFFDQVEPKYWKNVNDKNYRKAEKELLGAKAGLDAQVLGKAVPKGQEEDFAMVDDLASEDVEALILDEEEDAMVRSLSTISLFLADLLRSMMPELSQRTNQKYGTMQSISTRTRRSSRSQTPFLYLFVALIARQARVQISLSPV